MKFKLSSVGLDCETSYFTVTEVKGAKRYDQCLPDPRVTYRGMPAYAEAVLEISLKKDITVFNKTSMVITKAS